MEQEAHLPTEWLREGGSMDYEKRQRRESLASHAKLQKEGSSSLCGDSDTRPHTAGSVPKVAHF